MEKPLGYTAPSDSPALSVRPTPPGETATWKDFIALTKPGIIRSNVIAVFAGFWLASQWDLQYGKLIWTILGAVLVMASSCVFNNYFDRDFDMKMERTKKRALPTGKLSPRIVLWYAIILGIFGLAVLFSFSGLLAGLFGAVGMFVYVVVYTLWLKRTSTWSTSIGAISGAMPPVIGYVAVTGKVDLGAWLLFALLFLWQPPHFWALRHPPGRGIPGSRLSAASSRQRNSKNKAADDSISCTAATHTCINVRLRLYGDLVPDYRRGAVRHLAVYGA